jgi:anti-sigma factor RsiW
VLIDYVSGELSEEVRVHLAQHLEGCPPCVNYLRTYEVTIRMTRRLPDVPPPQALLERLKAALEQGENRNDIS